MKAFVIALLAFGTVAAGCTARHASSERVDGLVRIIAGRAASEDAAFFERYLDQSYKGWGKKLVEQINRSGMLDNYTSHLEHKSENEARLNYHYLEKGCHFQIDLRKADRKWSIKRIWFCR